MKIKFEVEQLNGKIIAVGITEKKNYKTKEEKEAIYERLWKAIDRVNNLLWENEIYSIVVEFSDGSGCEEYIPFDSTCYLENVYFKIDVERFDKKDMKKQDLERYIKTFSEAYKEFKIGEGRESSTIIDI